MKQMNWQTFQTQYPDKAANYPGGEQAYMQSNREAELAWSGGSKGPKTKCYFQQPQQAGLGAYQGQGPKQSLEDIPEQILGGPPRGGNPGIIPPGSDQIINKPPVNPYAPSNPVQDNPFSQQLTGFGETLGGYGEQIGSFGEQLGGFGNQITGFNEQFSNINNKLQNMEEGITSLTNKLNNQQQTQSSQPYSNPYQGLQSMLYGNYGGYQSPFTNNYSFY